jgi:hypothetical protein
MQPGWAVPLPPPEVGLAEAVFVGVGEGITRVAVAEGIKAGVAEGKTAGVAEGMGVWLETGKAVGLAVGTRV